MNRLAACALILLFNVSPATARSCFAQEGQVERTLPVIVMSPNEKFASDLKPANLKLMSDKIAVKGVTLDDGPRKVVLLLDISENMNSEDAPSKSIRWNNAQEMAKGFLATLPRFDWVSLAVFAEKEKEVVPFTHDFDLVRKAIDALPAFGSSLAQRSYGSGTHFGGALSAILKAQTLPPSFGDSVAVFSDGAFVDAGDPTQNSLRAQLLARGIRVFLFIATPRFRLPLTVAIGDPILFATMFGGGPDVVLSDIPRYQALKDAAPFFKATGGVTFQAAPLHMLEESFLPKSLERITRTAGEVVQKTYAVSLIVTEPITKQRKIRMELQESNGKALPKLILLYPEYLEPTP